MTRNAFTIRAGSIAAAIAVLAAALGAAACRRADGADLPATARVYGQPVAIGEGTARSYVTTVDGVPTEVGVALTEGALRGLPDERAAGGVHAHGHMTFETVLGLPAANPTPFRHVLVNWNPGGHEPPGIYDTPHFDFHFYVIDTTERAAIDPRDPAYQRKAERVPAPELIPERFILPAPLAFARMGVHWVDTTSLELHGAPFTATFIYGSWDGKVIFAEPMLTRAFLESKPQFSAELPAPRAGREAGYYVGRYSVRWDEGAREWHITLAEFGGRTIERLNRGGRGGRGGVPRDVPSGVIPQEHAPACECRDRSPCRDAQ